MKLRSILWLAIPLLLGGSVYLISAESLCGSTDGSPIKLNLDAVPPGLKVEIISQDKAESKRIKVTLDKAHVKSPSTQNLTVQLKLEVNGKESSVRLPVLVHE
jgi:hypothetical protein